MPQPIGIPIYVPLTHMLHSWFSNAEKVNNVEVFIELLEKKLNPYELVNRRIMRKISF